MTRNKHYSVSGMVLVALNYTQLSPSGNQGVSSGPKHEVRVSIGHKHACKHTMNRIQFTISPVLLEALTRADDISEPLYLLMAC